MSIKDHETEVREQKINRMFDKLSQISSNLNKLGQDYDQIKSTSLNTDPPFKKLNL